MLTGQNTWTPASLFEALAFALSAPCSFAASHNATTRRPPGPGDSFGRRGAVLSSWWGGTQTSRKEKQEMVKD